MSIKYEIKGQVQEIQTRTQTRYYLLDDEGNEVARIIPVENRDFSVLREDDNESE